MIHLSNFILMVSAASFTLGALHLKMCFQRRKRSMHVLFVLSALSLGVFALIERAMMLSTSPAEYGSLNRWIHVLVWLGIISIASFVHYYLRTGRTWLLWSIILTRTVALVLNFIAPLNLNYVEMSSINRVSFLGEVVSVPVGVPNPMMLVGHASLLFFVIYCVDAAIKVARDGEWQRALTIGGSIAVFSIAIFSLAILVFWGLVQWPMVASPFFLSVIFAMGFELTRDLERSAKLATDLVERETELSERLGQLNLSALAANVGIWSRNIGSPTIWVSDKWRELFEFQPESTVTFQDFLHKTDPDDRERVEATLKRAEAAGEEYEMEYRIRLQNNDTRWIGSRGNIEFADGKAVRLLGASVDITKRKLAEETAHDLSRKLMGAQEMERARLARELHDDLSQSLALLSIQLQGLSRETTEPDFIKKQVAELTSQISRLSSDVHRISHELHPSKLNQLGLESALRGFCREIAAARGLKVEFDAVNVPRSLPNDISLCLYRIVQEALQNVAKHSGASNASVKLMVADCEIQLLVSDNGGGFDTAAPHNESLGLISMDERIRAVNGTLKVESVIGAGTRVKTSISLPRT